MTEVEIKELARKYINSCTKRAGFVILTEGIMNDFIDLFVAGFMKCLELNEIKWHKVADGDLPKENKRYLCKIKEFVGSGISYECFDYDTEYSSWKNACGDVIAWCEIQKYTEE